MNTPTPAFFNPTTIGTLYRVPYQTRAAEAQIYTKAHNIPPAHTDQARICLLAIDVQNTFCLPDFELFVGGRSGKGALEDTQRLCEFIYRNLAVISEIVPTLDTHTASQIFHAVFWVNEAGEHPQPMTTISFEDVEQGKWQVNPAVAKLLATQAQGAAAMGEEAMGNNASVEAFAKHYAKQLSERGKYPLTIWPYHSMLGGVGHALVPAFEEACFFHNLARSSQTRFEMKGDNPLTENYSVLSPEVLSDAANQPIAQKNNRLIQHLLSFDAVIIAGQAKSHCVAWTVSDLLNEIQAVDPALAQKIYLLEDCTSPVVVPGVVDFTEQAAESYRKFAKAGMNIVQSVDSPRNWPGFPLKKQ
ncbi:MAG: isochorismatase [Phormidesmis sp. RL_2_1]|nr:isochorismatase [Phormidesmis sp. RL_2_1]